MANLPTSEEIIEAVRNSGWLLEQDSARSLDRHDFHTLMGWAYIDPDDPSTSREMDVHGYRQFFRSDDLKLLVSARVLIECKQSANPYVLIGREVHKDLREQQPTEHVLRYQNLLTGTTQLDQQRSQIHSVPAWTHLGLHAMPGSPSLYGFRASQMTRLDRQKTWTADNRGIFNSLMYPLAKALRAAQKHVKTTDMVTTTPMRDDGSWTVVALNFPVVVTSAPLYVIDATTEDVQPIPADWTTMTRELKTAKIEGTFSVDVVTYSALDAYLSERVVGFAQAVAEAVEAHPEYFTSNEAK